MELTDARGTKYVQKLWPEHCIQNSPGSDIAPALLGKMEALGDKYLISRKVSRRPRLILSGRDSSSMRALELPTIC